MLVERMIHKVIDEKMDIDKMLVVTFTNAAAAEMRERILEAIDQKLERNPSDMHLQKQMTLLHKASICTIHSFCLEVIHNYFYEIDIPSNFRIADTAEVDLLKQETLDELFEEKYLEQDSGFLKLLETYTTYRSDEALSELILSLYRFIQSSPFPNKWLQEKLNMFETRAIKDFAETEWGTIILQEIKEEMEEGILKLQNMQKKLNCFSELTKFELAIREDIENISNFLNHMNSWEEAYQAKNFIAWNKWPVDKKVTMDLKIEAKEVRDSVKKRINEVIGKFLTASSQEILKDLQAMEPILQELQKIVLEFSQAFAEKKKEKNCIDFNDIEHFALKILLGRDGQETEAAKKYKEKFVEIAIDEYQDSNLVQECILNSISRGNNIFMVGDVKQSIYKFRQARPELFLQKYDTYQLKENQKEADNLKIQLFRNFRSRKNVLDITNLVFESIMSKELGDISYSENEYLNYGANYPELATDLPEKRALHTHTTEIDIIDMKENDNITAFQEEEEEEEEQEKIEDEVLEAKFVAHKIQQLISSGYQVYDRKKGYRPITYQDIVILLRATSSLATIYEQELNNLDLPVFTDTSGSYLDTPEIQTMLSVLKIIDNPMQDIPLVTVLRSSIANFTDNDLMNIRLADKNCNFYEALLKKRISCEGELKEKIEKLLSNLENWKQKEQYMPLDELIWQIYLDTGYYHYVGLLPNGEMRQANLKMLFEKAKKYETASFKGLFSFIQFMERLKNQNGDLASAKLIGENENVIRIMSIHKSKGLEFPVVFLCACQKRFNLKDINDSILFHQDLGFGPTLIDTERKIKYNTLAKEAIKMQMKRETLSEEERILYVALTRAKEKLMITGRSKDLAKEIAKKEQLLAMYEQNEKLDSKLLKKSHSYLDWIEYVYLANQNKNVMLKGESIPLTNIMTLNSYSKTEISKLVNQQQEKAQTNMIQILQKKIESQDASDEYEAIKETLSWKYENEIDTKLPTKTSVSKIKEQDGQSEEVSLEEIVNSSDKELSMHITEITPKFLKEQEKITPAKRGSLVHLCIQKLNEQEEYSTEKITGLIEELKQKQIITSIEADSIDISLLENYTKKPLFAELKQAKEVHKEAPFYINLPAKELIAEAQNSEKNILVQGIIDLYYINQNDELILVDYKTDYVPKGKEKEVAEKYRKQLEIYTKALEEALQRKVSKAQICLSSCDWKLVTI